MSARTRFGIGVHPAHLAAHRVGVVGQQDRVAQGLAHLGLAVGADQGRDLADDELGDGEDLAVEVVEPARDLAGHLDVGVVVLAHRNDVALDAEDVGGLEHGVAEQPVGHLVLPGGAGHVLEAGHPLEPRHRDEVLEQRVELADLGDRRLEVEGRLLRVDAGRQLVEDHVAGVGTDLVDVGAGVLRREHVQVGDDEERLVLLLQPDPVLDAADEVTEVQLARGPVSGEHPFPAGGHLEGAVRGRGRRDGRGHLSAPCRPASLGRAVRCTHESRPSRGGCGVVVLGSAPVRAATSSRAARIRASRSSRWWS